MNSRVVLISGRPPAWLVRSTKLLETPTLVHNSKFLIRIKTLLCRVSNAHCGVGDRPCGCSQCIVRYTVETPRSQQARSTHVGSIVSYVTVMGIR